MLKSTKQDNANLSSWTYHLEVDGRCGQLDSRIHIREHKP